MIDEIFVYDYENDYSLIIVISVWKNWMEILEGFLFQKIGTACYRKLEW